MRKNRIKIIALFLLSIILLSGCFGKLPLDKRFNEEELIDYAKLIINELHINGIKETLNKYMREDYLEKYPVNDTNEDFTNMRASIGEFISYTETTVIGKESPDEKKEPVAVVAVTGNYKDGELLFMLTFDTDKKLIGFFVKK